MKQARKKLVWSGLLAGVVATAVLVVQAQPNNVSGVGPGGGNDGGGVVILPIEDPNDRPICIPQQGRFFDAALFPVSAAHFDAYGSVWAGYFELSPRWLGLPTQAARQTQDQVFQTLSLWAGGLPPESEFKLVAYRRSNGARCEATQVRTDSSGNICVSFLKPVEAVIPLRESEPGTESAARADGAPGAIPGQPGSPDFPLDPDPTIPEPEPEPEPDPWPEPMPCLVEELPACLNPVFDAAELQIVGASGEVVLAGEMREFAPGWWRILPVPDGEVSFEVKALGAPVPERPRYHPKWSLRRYLLANNVLASFKPASGLGLLTRTELLLVVNERVRVKARVWPNGKLTLKTVGTGRPLLLRDVRRIDVFDRRGRLLATRFPRPPESRASQAISTWPN